MCKFFSLVSDGKDKIMYFDWEIRKKIIAKELNYESDSHTSIADYFGYKAEKEDTLNKYEYNPLTKEFVIDQLNTIDDSAKVKEFCLNLNFKIIVPQLIIKPILNPLLLPKVEKVTKEDIKLLKQWDSVWDSVGDSVWDSVWNSVRDSVEANIGTFFDIKYKYDLSSNNKLWERGLVPSFDGKIWRLHSGEKSDIIFEITKSKLMEGK